jgi:hypothetical protein
MLPSPFSAPILPTRNRIRGSRSVFHLGEDFTARLNGKLATMAQDEIEIN